MAPVSLPLNLNLKVTATATATKLPELPEKTRNARVLVLGGTGRVGGSTATALSNLCPDLKILVAGRNREKGEALVSKLGGNSGFAQVDIDDVNSLETALKGVDLVVHAAGPFQQAERCSVLEAAINTKTAYVDVCDDTTYAWRAKSLMSRAVTANVPAITTAGIYPGVSNVMAAELVRAAESDNKDKHKPERLRFYYYTAGTGGAGPTILATSFLLLGEEVVAYNKGEKIKLKPYSGMLNIDFGKGIGKRDVYLLNLPEVRSAHEILGVPTVSARFGTAPFFWNWGMEAMTTLLPSEFLRDRNRVRSLVALFDPFVRALDAITGERVSMRVDLECSSGRNTVGIFSHRRLSVSVGIATAAFALAILEGSTQPGVWFPEEPQGLSIEAREVLLKRASQGTINFIMNRSPWMIETEPKELGLGIYV
ncbi:Saccharopine dehydrogenase, NADP binding domain [Sesbania bispinosa]|nr:Saccharopine dehydrogenase, NADP binding domain [Sesbania bispinosa]